MKINGYKSDAEPSRAGRSRILYIMNVDWNWIKQRPHFIADHLSLKNDVLVVYPYSWRRKNLVNNKHNDTKIYPFFFIPFGGIFPLITKLNAYIVRFMARCLINGYRPDFLWVTSPELFNFLPNTINSKLIYDCMDDVLAFKNRTKLLNSIANSENNLVRDSVHIFCSSDNLKSKLISRAGYPEKFSVVNNAFSPRSFENTLSDFPPIKKEGHSILGYIGTVSSWLNFDALIKIVNLFPLIEVHLIGPFQNLTNNVPRHERIIYLGPIEHADLKSRVSEFDALIMPFYVTDLIQSVDPVKLYEYIFFNKPIISVNYPEVQRFSDFVDFYDTDSDFLAIVERYLVCGFTRKYTQKSRSDFLISNTWEKRLILVDNVLEKQR